MNITLVVRLPVKLYQILSFGTAIVSLHPQKMIWVVTV